MKPSTCIWIAGLIWAFLETAHYGWNVVARSDAELICDGIAFVIFALAFLAAAIEQR